MIEIYLWTADCHFPPTSFFLGRLYQKTLKKTKTSKTTAKASPNNALKQNFQMIIVLAAQGLLKVKVQKGHLS